MGATVNADEASEVVQQYLDTDNPTERLELAKSAPEGSVDRVEFTAEATGSVGAMLKSDDRFAIWGPASVEVVDRENDRIKADALEDALPQLLKRQTLSYEHADQVVGEIKDELVFDEPVTVEIGDTEFTRKRFPTDVLDLDGLPPALYVAGDLYGDTRKSRNVREAVDDGDIRSFSISGEAIVTRMQTKGGEVWDDITKIDLSAVTLCHEGMNQLAEFAPLSKVGLADPSARTDAVTRATATDLLKSKTMGNDNPDDDALTEKGMRSILDDHLPDGDIPTVEDVEGIAKDTMQEELDDVEVVEEEPAPDPEPEADPDPEPEPDPEPDPEPEADDDVPVDKLLDTLKSCLPDDQYKTIEPTIQEKMGDGGDPADIDDEDEEIPGDDIAEKARTLGMDPSDLGVDERLKLAKADLGDFEKAGSGGSPGQAPAGASALDGDLDEAVAPDSSGETEKAVDADTATMGGSQFIGSDGEVNL